MNWEDELKKEPLEDKFIVINRKDLDYLNEQGKEELQVILMAISMGHTHDHKKQNDYYVCNKMNIDKLHAEIWYQIAYTIALLEQGNKLSEKDIKELSDKIYDILEGVAK